MSSYKWGYKSPNISIVTLLMTPLITTHELASTSLQALHTLGFIDATQAFRVLEVFYGTLTVRTSADNLQVPL